MTQRRNTLDRDALEIVALRADGARFANDGTRAVLERILDDLLHRIEDRRVSADDAAAILGRLRAFCADAPEPPGGLRALPALREALDPARFAARARTLASGYARLAAR